MNLFRPIKLLLFTTLVSVTFFFSQIATAALPKAFQANYSVSKGNMTLGNLHTTLKYSGNKYSYHKYTKATGLAALLTGIKITENTDGVFSGQNITPMNYFYNRAKRSKKKIDKATFTKTNAVGSYKDRAYNLKITKGTQDRASLELALARDLSLNKKRLSYPVISRGERSQYNFQRLGSEVLKTPAGAFNTIKVKVLRKGKKRETIFWMAKELGYMPVKINHREKDDVITSIIKNYKRL